MRALKLSIGLLVQVGGWVAAAHWVTATWH